MAKGEILGLMACPECGEDGAQIKRAKSGLLYRWCAKGCNAQFFARNADQEFTMRANLFEAKKPAVSVTDTGEKPAAPAAPVTVRDTGPKPTENPVPIPAPKPAPAKGGFTLSSLMGEK